MKYLERFFNQSLIILILICAVVAFLVQVLIGWLFDLRPELSTWEGFKMVFWSASTLMAYLYVLMLNRLNIYSKKYSFLILICGATVLLLVGVNFYVIVARQSFHQFSTGEFLFYLVAIFSNVKLVQHASFCIRSIELKKRASISEYASVFVLLYICLIGCWFVHPRVRKILSAHADEEARVLLSESGRSSLERI